VIFEWDRSKAAANWRKHGVSFQEAATIFGDALALTYDDPDHSFAEQRFITIGVSRAKRILIVAHMDRGEKTRIISARETSARERSHYEEKG
jgi:uncharacterized DUF497 family protein